MPRSRAICAIGSPADGPTPPPCDGTPAAWLQASRTPLRGDHRLRSGVRETGSSSQYATAGWVDWRNNRRLHGTLGMITPNEAEQAHYAALIPQEQPV